MQLSGFKVRCVGKRSREWDNGDINYEIQLSNGLGGIMTASCSKALYDKIVPLDVVYDVELNVDTNGYKHYINLVSLGE